MSDTLTIDVETAGGSVQIEAVMPAENIAVHRSLNDRPFYSVTQISTGQRLACFHDEGMACDFGERVAALVPALVAGSPLSDDDKTAIVHLVTKHGGWR